ncbi:hypothetical protein SS50377_21028 [Spironucleus salmonicida]|uniref:Transmembrane protein n=1 Tax=Spironucleus salmonicida TaxID=348837 RepID=A0A9P8M0K6_9EUKA|nr:hypothetical protein SS50377_21028 [Spironucleus salmonicida]
MQYLLKLALFKILKINKLATTQHKRSQLCFSFDSQCLSSKISYMPPLYQQSTIIIISNNLIIIHINYFPNLLFKTYLVSVITNILHTLAALTENILSINKMLLKNQVKQLRSQQLIVLIMLQKLFLCFHEQIVDFYQFRQEIAIIKYIYYRFSQISKQKYFKITSLWCYLAKSIIFLFQTLLNFTYFQSLISNIHFYIKK